MLKKIFTFQKYTYTQFRLLFPVLMAIFHCSQAQCPWNDKPDLQATCVCAFNLARQMSVQCDQVFIMKNQNTDTNHVIPIMLYIFR